MVIDMGNIAGLKYYPKRAVVQVSAYRISVVALILLLFFKLLVIADAGWRTILWRTDIKKKRGGYPKKAIWMYPVEVLGGRKAWERRVQ